LSKKIISYWLDSLVMADQLQDSSRFTDSSALPIARSSLAAGRLDDLDHGQIRQILASKAPIDAQGKSKKPSNRVLTFPFILKRHPADKQPLIPLWIPALIINDRGMLAPDPEHQPWMPRQLLNPAASNALGDLGQFDRFFLENDCPTDWPNYWKFCGRLLERVTGQAWGEFRMPNYQTLDRGLILPNRLIAGASMHIQALYRQILDLSALPPLLKRYASLRDRHLQDILPPTAQRPYEAQHLGQMGDRYPLSPSQREALHHFFSLDRGEILAINGPPGTGKTTLLQSVIASLWIRQALQQALPPIIVASSTNNQAVTNIITSFQQPESVGDSPHRPFEQRWLPKITSHGLYLSSSSKTEEAMKAGLQAVAPGRKGLILAIEDLEYRKQAHQYFLTQFNNHTDQVVTKVSSALGWLHQQLQQTVAEIQILAKPPAELDLLRYRAFWLATHYWEARWLLDMANCKPSKYTSYNYTVRDWQRLAMLAPCFVATFHMAPRFFQFNREARWEFIDLLIVDEAGQVSPEIAGATFALAQQALVVGDMQQIEPVWAVTDNVNMVNLQHHKLAKKTEERERFEAMGLSAASGSVMRIAQRSSCYQKYPEQRGLLLTEHRRCLPEIISYCNDLCYGGYLEPKRDPLAAEHMPKLRDGFPLPPLGYLFIPGQSEQSNGSRRNPPEAQRIAQWLLEQSAVLINYYQRPLSEIVAILSPFAAQKQVLEKALHSLEIHDLTVGTVHALQGAERPIVIFSPVYDHNAGQTFFLDRKPNMLNVAVSRAKDSFLVFGDLRVFNPSHQTPAGLLGRHLFDRPENALPQY
jgi:ABC-type dipeptide/oligopeptide/nickel transport system ATPase component